MTTNPTTMTTSEIKALNPETAAAWLCSGRPVSDAGMRVLRIAIRNGGYVAAGVGAYAGHTERVAASAITGLVRKGYLVACYSPDGGLAGRLSDSSLARLADGARSSLRSTAP